MEVWIGTKEYLLILEPVGMPSQSNAATLGASLRRVNQDCGETNTGLALAQGDEAAALLLSFSDGVCIRLI